MHTKLFLPPLIALLFLLLAQYEVELATPKRMKGLLATGCLIVALAVSSYWAKSLPVFICSLLAFLLLVLRQHYYATEPKRRKLVAQVGIFSFVAAILYATSRLPHHPLQVAFFAVFGTLILLNARFYVLLAAKRGRLHAIAAIPFHLLFHLYSGIAFAIGLTRYLWDRALHRDVVKAHSQLRTP